MTHGSPVVRISASLIALICSILLVFDLLGFFPVPANPELTARARLCEQLATQAAAALEAGDLRSIRGALQSAVHEREEVLSAALRDSKGRLLVAYGAHRELWDDATTESTSTQGRVTLSHEGQTTAAIEVRFRELESLSWIGALMSRPALRMILLLGVVGFLAYTIYLRRTLRYLDPSTVIPARVQTALDVMMEGVLLLDADGRIVLANAAFAVHSGREPAELFGKLASGFEWKLPRTFELAQVFPWTKVLHDATNVEGTALVLDTPDGMRRSFVANAAPVLDGWGNAKGAIVTFDDVTEFERHRRELEAALVDLEKSQDEIRLQNEELQVLARYDNLTGVANRRFFLERGELGFAKALKDEDNFCCVMADIDHFKCVNDTHGHAMGDEVIRRVAEALSGAVRSSDAVCRYGGEEFCIMLQGASYEGTAIVAERIRAKIASPGFTRVPISVSFGVSSIESGAQDLQALINQADEALYYSKNNGRNRVTRWDQMDEG